MKLSHNEIIEIIESRFGELMEAIGDIGPEETTADEDDNFLDEVSTAHGILNAAITAMIELHRTYGTDQTDLVTIPKKKGR